MGSEEAAAKCTAVCQKRGRGVREAHDRTLIGVARFFSFGNHKIRKDYKLKIRKIIDYFPRKKSRENFKNLGKIIVPDLK